MRFVFLFPPHTFQAKKYSPLEKECETKECQGVFGLELTKCTRKCISQVCYDELYAWDEVRLWTLLSIFQ